VVCDGGGDEVLVGLAGRLVVGKNRVADLDLGDGDISVSCDDNRLGAEAVQCDGQVNRFASMKLFSD
jgi:hypothetical protein